MKNEKELFITWWRGASIVPNTTKGACRAAWLAALSAMAPPQCTHSVTAKQGNDIPPCCIACGQCAPSNTAWRLFQNTLIDLFCNIAEDWKHLTRKDFLRGGWTDEQLFEHKILYIGSAVTWSIYGPMVPRVVDTGKFQYLATDHCRIIGDGIAKAFSGWNIRRIAAAGFMCDSIDWSMHRLAARNAFAELSLRPLLAAYDIVSSPDKMAFAPPPIPAPVAHEYSYSIACRIEGSRLLNTKYGTCEWCGSKLNMVAIEEAQTKICNIISRLFTDNCPICKTSNLIYKLKPVGGFPTDIQFYCGTCRHVWRHI